MPEGTLGKLICLVSSTALHTSRKEAGGEKAEEEAEAEAEILIQNQYPSLLPSHCEGMSLHIKGKWLFKALNLCPVEPLAANSLLLTLLLQGPRHERRNQPL
jgi:hypothetical protein